jgi:hypothetical protein
MVTVSYEIVEHDGGWAYRVKDVYSETFATHEDAVAAARDAAERQHLAGATTAISFQDRDSQWHEELAEGNDRPDTEVVDAGDDAQEARLPLANANSPAPANRP